MNKILEFRKKAGWSQAELADMVGVTQSAISNYEHETRKPDWKTAKALSAASGGLLKERDLRPDIFGSGDAQ